MNAAATTPPPCTIGVADITPEEADAVLDGALVTDADVAVLDLNGPGAVACLQGMFTNDIEQAGEAGFVYGAVLTPKGMIVSDAWISRDGAKVRMFAPRDGLDALQEVFQRSLPPRLARVVDRSDDMEVLRLVGPRTHAVAERAGVGLPAEGRTAVAIAGQIACQVAVPEYGIPFELQLAVGRQDAPAIRDRLQLAGAVSGGAPAAELARILAGWPRLGAEIDAKTLPQEVRFDEIGGVSYTKGCYVGQETVARLHFRGRPNRHLVGLVWHEPIDLNQSAVVQDNKPRGRVTSAAWLAPLERYIGLGIVRREVDRGRDVTAGGANAGVVDLPFALNE